MISMNSTDNNTLFSKFNGIICLFDESDQITYVNNTFEDTLDYKKHDLIRISISDLIHPDDKADFINAITTNNQNKITLRLFHSSGSHLYFSVSVYQFGDQFQIIGKQLKRSYKGFHFDIKKEDIADIETDQLQDVKDISEVIGNNLQSVQIALDNLPIDLWIKDANSKYVYMNKIMLKRTKIDPGSYLHKTDFDLYEPDVANDFITSDLEAIKSHKKLQFEFESKNDRYTKWTEVSKVPIYNANDEFIGLIGSAIDISQLKSIEKQLTVQAANLNEIIDSVFDFTIHIDNDGLIFQATQNKDSLFTAKEGEAYQITFQNYPAILKAIGDAYNMELIQFKTFVKDKEYTIIVKAIIHEESANSIIVLGKECHDE